MLSSNERRSGAQLAVAADRTALAVWESDHVMGRLFDRVTRPADNAIEITSLDFALSADSTSDDNASVTNSAERWAVAWEARGDSGRRQIMARTFELVGADPVGFGDATVSASETENQLDPDVFALTDGRSASLGRARSSAVSSRPRSMHSYSTTRATPWAPRLP